MRNGELVGNVETKRASRNELAKMIVGKTVNYPKREKVLLGSEFMKVQNVSHDPKTDSNEKLHKINLSLKGGQIIGVAGVAGNGQRLLAQLLTGHIRPSKGEIYINNLQVSSFNPKNFMNEGIAYIPEDRNNDGLVGDMSVWENVFMTETNKKNITSNFGWINEKKCIENAIDLCEKYDVRTQNIFQPARHLSGGNVQKLLIGRWLDRKPKILIACQPTRGLDEGAIAFVQKLILSAKAEGNAVLLISEDLDELLSISDLISVMYRGNISDSYYTDNLNRLKVGLMMAGDGFNV